MTGSPTNESKPHSELRNKIIGELRRDPVDVVVIVQALDDLVEQLEALQTAVDDGVLVFVDTMWFNAYHHLASNPAKEREE